MSGHPAMATQRRSAAGMAQAFLLLAALLGGCASTAGERAGDQGRDGGAPERVAPRWPGKVRTGHEQYRTTLAPGEAAVVLAQTRTPGASGEYVVRADIRVPTGQKVFWVKQERSGAWVRLLWASTTQGVPGDYFALEELQETQKGSPAEGVALYLRFPEPVGGEQRVRLRLGVRDAGSVIRTITRTVILVPLPPPRQR